MKKNHKNHIAFALALSLVIGGAACAPNTPDGAQPSGLTAASPTAGEPSEPLEKRPPNASKQKPAFAGQTPARGVKPDVAFEVTVLARGLDRPWAGESLPNGDLLITEKPGRMRIVSLEARSDSQSVAYCRSALAVSLPAADKAARGLL